MKHLFFSACLFLAGNYVVAQNTFPGTGNVGIGTTSPGVPLDVVGNIRGTGIIGETLWTGDGTQSMIRKLTASTPMRFLTSGGVEEMRIDANGRIGLGTASPRALLDVNGSAIISSGPGNTLTLEKPSTNIPALTFMGAASSSTIEAGDDYLTVWTGSNRRMTVLANGNVGIGTEDPQTKMHVYNGHVLIEDGYALRSGSSSGAHLISRSGSGIVALGSGNSGDQLTFNANGSEQARLNADGNLLIGKTSQSNDDYKLDVAGKVRANEIVVNTTGADFVFDEDYKIQKLEEVESFIKANKHLPGIAPAKQMQEEGVGVAELQTKLLQKIEELTLYVIELDKRAKTQEEKILLQQKEIENLKKNKQ